ncbi:MAG: ShlB/FhaC/HecB family hemolysin secretion/activation protein [Vampirovibrio sp.]|nr:ShlB/FhaC/HecB family hemolysin secretion/activation protein [Vampirovibrio sp.]
MMTKPSCVSRSIYSLSLSIAVGAMVVGSQAFLPVLAQVTVPTQTNPGLIAPQSTDDLYKDKERAKKREIQKEETEDKIDFDVAAPEGGVYVESQQFNVDHISIEGNTIISDDEIRPLVTEYEGQTTSLDQLGNLVDDIGDLYHQQGFLTTVVFIPPQEVEDGQVTIQVLEGMVGDIEISGNKYYKTWALERNLDYQSGEVLNLRDLEDTLNQMNQQQQFRLKAILSPGEETGETDLKLEVSERQPWQVTLSTDNQGRPFIGMYRWGVGVSNVNLTGVGDRLFTQYIGARGTNIAQASYFRPISRYGTELGGTFSFSHVNVDLDTGPQQDIDGFAYNYGLVLSQPLMKDRTLVADAGFNMRRVISTINDNTTNIDDIATLVFGINLDKVDRYGRTFARAQTTVGPDWFGANRQFWKASGVVNRLIRLPKSNYLIFRATGQISPDALPPAEQYQVGGAFSVRGFTEGLLVGDRGYTLGLEHRWPIPGLRYVCPWMADRVQGATFFDFGQTWLDDSQAGRISDASRTLLMGAGLGVRAQLTRLLEGFIDFGWGISDNSGTEPNAQPTVRVHFGVTSKLLPEIYKVRGDETTEVSSSENSTEANVEAEATDATETDAQNAFYMGQTDEFVETDFDPPTPEGIEPESTDTNEYKSYDDLDPSDFFIEDDAR